MMSGISGGLRINAGGGLPARRFAMEQNQLLSHLNALTRRTHTLDEVYLFDVILCDNEIDRDGDCFSDSALAELQKRFVGVTGIFDHDPRSGNQNARIFRTEIVTDPERRTKTGQPYRCLKANAYMVRTDGNADLIREIDAGIKKEVSISCAVGKQVCSVCGADRLKAPCSHIKGRTYGGKLCYTTLDGVNDVYEWSFVAVPAQRGAGVTKTLGGKQTDPEKEMLRDACEKANQLLDQLTDDLRKDVIRLCYRNGESVYAKVLADSTIHMDAGALSRLKQSLLTGIQAAESGRTAPQLMPEQNQPKSLTEYRVGGKTEV